MLYWHRMTVVGIDEVGRGALAGPVCIGIFIINEEHTAAIRDNAPCAITDSKQVTEKRRDALFAYFLKCKKEKLCDFVILSVTAEKIDRYGISVCIKEMIEKGLGKLALDLKTTHILLDGGLKAPVEYTQQTIIKGDVTEFAISCASIVAKVYRDEYMKKQSELYPLYGFENHVGYGTLAHRKAIQKVGPCVLHRRTFCKNIL